MKTINHPPALRRQTISRRRMLQNSTAGLVALATSKRLLLPDHWAKAAETQSTLPPLNRFPRMLQRYFVDRVRQSGQASQRNIDQLTTKADAQRHVREIRARIAESFGPFPEKTPLNPRVTGTIQRDAYRIEKIIFESRPGFLVTANLYIPTGREFPLPGVVGTCGHSNNGKCEAAYQSYAQGLARMGYVVLIFDPIGQGERLQYPDAQLRSRIGVGVREHLQAGNQQFLVGEFIGSWRAWDGIRALDYLLTREEVDPTHLGVTGNSGGGAMTTWLCGVESRWTMAAPSCFVTTLRRNMENELPADTEQCPPKVLALELDFADFLAAMAPKPVILLAKEKDFFDVRGAETAYARLKRLYTLLEAEDNVALFTGPTPHGFSQENREAMYRWFNRATGVSDAKVEPKLVLENDKTLQCTPDGQVSELKSRTVFSYTQAKSRDLAKQRPRFEGDALRAAVSNVLKLPPREGVADYRIFRGLPSRKYPKPHTTTYAVETEPGVQAVVYRLSDERHGARPPRDTGPALLYVSHHSADAELRDEPLVKELIEAQPRSSFHACDLRGVGESRPNTCGHDQFLKSYGSDYFYAIYSIMLDYPYVGQKTFDLLRVVDWLAAQGHAEIHLAAKGWGALPATFAGLLSDRVTRVTLKNALTSYAEVAESEDYTWPLSALPRDVLASFDLPDCYRALEAKGLRQIDPWGAIV